METTRIGCAQPRDRSFATESQIALLIEVLKNWEVQNQESVELRDWMIAELMAIQMAKRCAGRTNPRSGWGA